MTITAIMPLLREELEASDNPFDWALYAGVCALQSGRKDRERVHYLKILNDKLDSKGWHHDKKLALPGESQHLTGILPCDAADFFFGEIHTLRHVGYSGPGCQDKKSLVL